MQRKKYGEVQKRQASAENDRTSFDNESGSQRADDLNDDPMRVRGSFYMAKGLDKPVGKQHRPEPAFGQKSPRNKKLSPNRISLPKKKQKLRLEPLGPRTTAARPFATADAPNADNAQQLQDGDVAVPKVSDQAI